MKQATITPSVQKGNSLAKAILLAGFVAGVLDITAAMLLYMAQTGKNPVTVLHFVASGVFGSKAFGGGITMSLLGLILHFGIAYSFTLFYFLLYPKIKALSRNKVIAGLVYGIFIWMVMNLVVLPLSNVPQSPFNISKAITGTIVIMLMVGLPISLLAHYYFNRNSR